MGITTIPVYATEVAKLAELLAREHWLADVAYDADGWRFTTPDGVDHRPGHVGSDDEHERAAMWLSAFTQGWTAAARRQAVEAGRIASAGWRSHQ